MNDISTDKEGGRVKAGIRNPTRLSDSAERLGRARRGLVAASWWPKSERAAAKVRSAGAFTLIEMLVVIAVIGVLAAMIFPVTGAVARTRTKARVNTEMQQVITAIETYKSKRGQYPPDNHSVRGVLIPYFNQLYYELAGTTNWTASGQVWYQTSDGLSRVPEESISPGLSFLGSASGVAGFVNSSSVGSVEEGSTVINCLQGSLRADQLATTSTGFKVLVGSVPLTGLPAVQPPNAPYPGSVQIGTTPTSPWYCTWRYNSSNPTNNPSSYDLWIDVLIGGKTNRFSNWSRDPEIVSSP